MFTIKNITLQNILSHNNIAINTLQHNLIQGTNGIGKSSIIKAINLLYFTPHAKNLKNIIKWGKTKGKITSEFIANGENNHITLTIEEEHGKIKTERYLVTENNVRYVNSDVVKYLEYILPNNLYENAISSQQLTCNYLQKTPTELKNHFAEFLYLIELKPKIKKATEKKEELQNDLQNSENKILKLETLINNNTLKKNEYSNNNYIPYNPQIIQNYEEHIKKQEKHHEYLLSQLNTSLDIQYTALQTEKNTMEQLYIQPNIQNIEQNIILNKTKLNDINIQLQQLQTNNTNIETQKNKIATYKTNLDQYEKNILDQNKLLQHQKALLENAKNTIYKEIEIINQLENENNHITLKQQSIQNHICYECKQPLQNIQELQTQYNNQIQHNIQIINQNKITLEQNQKNTNIWIDQQTTYLEQLQNYITQIAKDYNNLKILYEQENKNIENYYLNEQNKQKYTQEKKQTEHELKELTDKITKHNNNITQYNSIIEKLKTLNMMNNKEIKKSIDDTKTNILETKKALNQENKNKIEYEQREKLLQTINQELDNYNTQFINENTHYKKLEEKLNNYKLVIKHLQKYLPTYILTVIIKHIEQLANIFLQKCYNNLMIKITNEENGCYIEYAKKINNIFKSFQIIKLASSYESQVINTAIKLAISSAINIKNLFLDEIESTATTENALHLYQNIYNYAEQQNIKLNIISQKEQINTYFLTKQFNQINLNKESNNGN